MKRRVWTTGAAVGLIVGGLVLSGVANAGGHGRGPGCSEATLRGTYGIQLQGTRFVTPGNPASGIESVVGVVIRTYDGAGTFTQIDNVKGSVNGIVPDRPGGGTYEVSSDCSAVVHLQPGPGIVIEERLVIVQGGEEVRSIVASPLSVMVSAEAKRIGKAR